MNTKELRVEMLRFGDTNHELAVALDTSDATCSKKINGKAEFTQTEISEIKKRYSLSADRLADIFFAPEVSQKETGE